jgi:diguanylate cyclase (GGDEF)-like protein/putative nucleotidyltransferase with HDIG domain
MKPPMNDLPRAGRIYVASVIVAGATVLGICLPRADFLHQPVLLAALVVLASVTAALDLTLPFTAGGSAMSVAYAVDFAALLLVGPHKAMVVASISALAACRLNKKERQPLHHTLFSMAAMVLTVQCAGLALAWLTDSGAATALLTIGKPLVGTAAVYSLISTGLVATAMALSSHESMATTWRAGVIECAPGSFVGACTAAMASVMVMKTGYWIAPLGFAPIYLTYRTYKVYRGRIEGEQRHVQQTSDLHLATIEALARAIDAKDQNTQTHIRRVQTYAARMAKAVGLSQSEIQCIKTAALLHDIGKLAVPEHILSKPGPLTQEEFQKVRIHPEIGAEIIAAVPFPYPVAPIILSHHERWDGKGYPQGLKGEAIPLGARILTIVDYFDAITTERPYHKALPHESAIALLRHEVGLALDPTLVRVFIDLLPSLVADSAESEALDARNALAAEGPDMPTVGLAPGAFAPNAFENIALAHREIYALYEIAQSMGTSLGVADTMALISSKLMNIIPWSGSALFLTQGDGETLKCRFAAGVDSPQLLNATVRLGEGLTGWVAKNRRTLVNADPGLAFELQGLPRPSLKSAMVCPLYVNDTFLGCLALYHVDPNRYTDDHRRLLEQIAEQAGPVIHNSIVFEQTQEDSLTDPLTGLPNRRSMFVHLSRELARAERLKSPVALIVMDIDGFKTINDSYGHHVGDRALREVSLALQSALRPYDLCVRYAGDEFIVVLTDCSRETAEAKRHELQQRVSRVEFEVRTGKRLRLAASAGASVYPHDGANYETLLAEADHRMYRDKALRRGRLSVPHAAGPEFTTDVHGPTPAPSPLSLALPQTVAT